MKTQDILIALRDGESIIRTFGSYDDVNLLGIVVVTAREAARQAAMKYAREGFWTDDDIFMAPASIKDIRLV